MNAEDRTRLETLAGRLVDAEGAITSAQETLARVLDAEIVDEEPADTGPEAGEWVAVDATKPKDGDRVRLGGADGVAVQGAAWLAAFEIYGDDSDLRGGMLWRISNYPGATVELWVPAEVTLPLPTEPEPFWGRVERDGETYVGWVLHAPCGHFVNMYSTVRPAGGYYRHHAQHVTRLPIPDSEREKLR